MNQLSFIFYELDLLIENFYVPRKAFIKRNNVVFFKISQTNW